MRTQILFDAGLPEKPVEERKELRPGEVCPFCGQGIVDYDGLLNLACPACGAKEGGCFT